mmetsp:Transcript_42502/g.92596  ORF Transcript_42502/g.92596 Transcript_42502/m.92596 type:complete len:577 (-) Transcript_42502:380-2110(-)
MVGAGRLKSQGSPARFKDVADAVGHNLQVGCRRADSCPHRLRRAATSPERLRCQLQRLQAGQKTERARVTALRKDFSECMLAVAQAQQHIFETKTSLVQHERLATDFDCQIGELAGDLDPIDFTAEAKSSKSVSRNSSASTVASSSCFRRAAPASTSAHSGHGAEAAFPTPWLKNATSGSADAQHASEPFNGMLMEASSPRGSLRGWSTATMDKSTPQLQLPPGNAQSSRLIKARTAKAAPGRVLPVLEQEKRRALSAPCQTALKADSHRTPTPTSAKLLEVDQRPLEGPVSQIKPGDICEIRRQLSRELIKQAGSARKAFQALDLSGSGHISMQEFASGVGRLGIRQVGGIKRWRDLFTLLDQDKNSVLDWKELFQDESQKLQKPSIADLENCWQGSGQTEMKRGPMWKPGPEEELEALAGVSRRMEVMGAHRKWMSATMRRLKSRGTSDARCREVVAAHLPKGTGPKDRDGITTFSNTEVKASRKEFEAQVNFPAQNIQRVVCDMREQRKALSLTRQQLWALTEEPAMREKILQDMQADFSGLNLLLSKQRKGRRRTSTLHRPSMIVSALGAGG